jgi:outer membrane protein OmpA-like peptidoglycan-associated protein
LLEKEPLLRESIKGSPFTLHQQGATWVVTAPAQKTFNPDRPDLLLPAALGPIARIAKLMEADKDAAVLILGHTAESKDHRGNQQLSTARARSVASIFRLSGLTAGRMTHLGMGSSHLLAQAKYLEHNHRVEIIVMPSVDVQGVMAVYRPAYMRQLALSQAK